MKLIGSPSTPFATTTGRRLLEATAASLRPAGKPPPPRPRRPLAVTSSIRPRDEGSGPCVAACSSSQSGSRSLRRPANRRGRPVSSVAAALTELMRRAATR